VAIVGGGIGGVALTLAIARNNRQLVAQSTLRCAMCGVLCGHDFESGRDSGPRTADGYIAQRRQQHYERFHADRHAYEDCFPAARPPTPRPLTVKTFEKDAGFSARRQGYGLTMQQAYTALERLGLAEAARAEDTPSDAHYIFDGSGQLINVFTSNAFGSASAPDEGSSWERRRNVTIPRQRLRALLIDELSRYSPSAIEWGWEYGGHSACADGRIGIEFESRGDGGQQIRRSVVARALVGADGIWSGVRDQMLLSEGAANLLEYLGVAVVLGIAPSDHPLCHGNTLQMLDGSTRLYSMPFATGEAEPSTFWQLSFPCEEAEAHRYRHDTAALLKELGRRCAHWHEPVPSLLRHTPREAITCYPVYDRGESYPFHASRLELPTEVSAGAAHDRVTLLGDAAHPMAPFKAQGANQALLDAVHLADALAVTDLASRSATANSLRELELQMHARSERQRLRSRTAAATLHCSDVRAAATTGKALQPPSEELLAEFRRARIGCWDAEASVHPLVRKIKEARKVVRRRESRRRVRQRDA